MLLLRRKRRTMEQDITTNSLLEYNDVFADIVNVNLLENRWSISAEDLEVVPTEGSYKDLEGTHHRLFRDSLRLVKSRGVCIAFIGCESQTAINRAMPVRDMGYNYVTYIKQIREIVAENTKMGRSAYAEVLHDNEKLIPVVTVVLYFGKKPWTTPLSLMDILEIPEKERDLWKKLINDHKITVIHMANQPEEIRAGYRSDFKVIADYLSYAGDREKLIEYLRNNTQPLLHVEQVLDMLHALSGDNRFQTVLDHYKILDNLEEKEKKNQMCLLLDIVEEEGISKGISKGISQGTNKASQICKKIQKGKSPEIIAEEIEEPLYYVQRVCEIIENITDVDRKYEVDEIYNQMYL